MQVKNSYFWFKSALTSEQCQKIIDLGVSEIERIKKAGGRVDATTHGYNDKVSMIEKGLDVKPQIDKTLEELQDKKVHIWDANGSREFLDSRGLQHLEVNDLGPVYGHQWRHFNAPYQNCHTDYTNQGIDQIQYIVDALKDPSQHNSRRLVMCAWNPCQMSEMALPPCHILAQFYVRDHKYLSCTVYQRSGDVGLGVPFNIASYSFLTHIIANHCGLIAEKFVHFLGDAHVYENHKPMLLEQIERKPYDFPTISISTVRKNIEDYDENDIKWNTPYVHHDEIKMTMSA